MTRSKVNLAYIANDTDRKNTFKRRMPSLVKKAKELSILCAIDVLMIIFGPYDPKPYVWPPNLEAQRIIARLRNTSPEEQNRRMLNQTGFIMQQLQKTNDQIVKLKREVQHKEQTGVMFDCLAGKRFEFFNISDLNELNRLFKQNITATGNRIETLDGN